MLVSGSRQPLAVNPSLVLGTARRATSVADGHPSRAKLIAVDAQNEIMADRRRKPKT